MVVGLWIFCCVMCMRFSCFTCGISVPQPGIGPMSPALKGGFWTTGTTRVVPSSKLAALCITNRRLSQLQTQYWFCSRVQSRTTLPYPGTLSLFCPYESLLDFSLFLVTLTVLRITVQVFWRISQLRFGRYFPMDLERKTREMKCSFPSPSYHAIDVTYYWWCCSYSHLTKVCLPGFCNHSSIFSSFLHCSLRRSLSTVCA